MFEIGGADIKLPQFVALLRLQAYRRRFTPQTAPIDAPVFSIAIHGAFFQHGCWRLEKPAGRVDAVDFQETNRLRRG